MPRPECEGTDAPPETAANDGLAAALSFWVPGLGQLFRRQWIKGLLMVAVSWIASDRVIATACDQDACAPFVAWSGVALVVWIGAVRDARKPEGRGWSP